MGNCWAQCFGLFRQEANRIQRGGGSKYFRSSTAGEHYTIEFENLVESDEGESSQSCPRPVSEEEINHLKEQCYTAISDKQVLIDEKLNAELVAEEEKLRLEEEAVFAAQREAARLAKERKLKEGKQQQRLQRTKPRSEPERNDPRHKPKANAEFEVYLQSVKAQSEAFRSNRLGSETNVVTPNTESSWDYTSKTDATSLDLEWEDEEGMNQMGPAWERSKTEEDILRAALRPGGKQLDSGPTSTSEDSNALEWENDFVNAHPEDSGDHGDEDFEGFVNPVLDTPTEEAGQKASSDQQER
ncbi:AP-1 complex-associated regulatory protein-like isoform X2 [Sinocyclocheilus rhinocerous]|uniref:AP-1 complex-associated regulatory protein-like isoform X1 n=1 Tax=Sinocyclocheilus rhinocerous TaxID=307959 RepID=UPI0007B99379|nr:PREDICTED: AP-1 complex-associated regulatory protein-like isoform X1 [Sinocyclocheilus rhinocerous]XP_016377824.1 PREDICTED: AP-1 complex-associated regulatory protein-like isoform X1 [Sinocyclocheilus rhinocerous]XP_016377825.1 PREDICTED: AP-1 complex-associated regulatory protein-like isoform X2 [Sinocyclocheilus rhinocerous]